MAWDADSLNKIAGALNAAYSPDQVFRAPDFTGHPGRECGEHRTTGPRAWCHDCTEWCCPEEPCKGCELPLLRARLAKLEAESERLRAVMTAARRIAGYEFSIERHRPLIDALAALDATDDQRDEVTDEPDDVDIATPPAANGPVCEHGHPEVEPWTGTWGRECWYGHPITTGIATCTCPRSGRES